MPRAISGRGCPAADGGVVIIGSHLDSVPDGGWLDGAYGVMCAVEVLRCLAARGPLPCPLALVEWADEEGARFGHSLFGSSAVAGTLNVAEVRELADASGLRLGDVVAEHGVHLDRLDEARQEIPVPGLTWKRILSRGRCWRERACRSARCPERWASSVTG
jgi:Predicted aminopeptidases